MKTPSHSNTTWTFIYQDILPIETPTTLQITKEGKTTFSIPYGSQGIIITLDGSIADKKEGFIQGTYRIIDDSITGKVTFMIQHKGKKLIGKPEGFHGIKVWEIRRK